MSSTSLIKRTMQLIVAGLCLSFAASAFAQRPGGRLLPDSSQIAVIVDTLAAQIQLTDIQKTKVDSIYRAFYQEMGAMRGKSNGDFRSMRRAMGELIDKRNVTVTALLDDNQKGLFEKVLKDEQERRRERMRGRRGRMN